jgi:hypothetical protein
MKRGNLAFANYMFQLVYIYIKSNIVDSSREKERESARAKKSQIFAPTHIKKWFTFLYNYDLL